MAFPKAGTQLLLMIIVSPFSMKYRILGKTGLRVSEIGFGCWGIGGAMWGKTDDEEAKN